MLDFRCLLPEHVRQRDKLGVERCGKSQLFGFQAEKSRILTSRRDFTLPCGLAEGKQPISARRSWVGYCKLWGPRSTRMACPWSMMFYMKVSWNRGTPKSSILVGFSLINHPAIGYSMYGTPHMMFFSGPQELPLYAEPKKHGLKWSGWSVVGCGYPDPSRATETWKAKCYVFYLQQGFSHCFDASEGLRSSKQIYLFVCRQTLMLDRKV